MNDERQPPIAEALEAYARERRQVLGGALRMPGPQRARLQREVELRLGRSSERDRHAGWAWWGWRRPAWVWGAAAALVIGLVTVWWPAGPVEREVAVHSPAVAGPEGPGPAGLPAAVAPPPAARPVASASRLAAPLETSAKLAGGEADSLGAASSADLVPPPPAVAARPAGAAYRAEGDGALAQAQFSQAVRGPVLPTMNSFRLEQAGREVRIVDEDGSVYEAQLGFEGPVLAQAPPARPVAPRAPVPRVEERARPTSRWAVESRPSVGREAGRGEAPVAASAAGPGPVMVGIRAQGTNRVLGQRVVLAGNLVVTNFAGAPRVESQAALLTDPAALQFLFSNSRLEGQMTVGATGEFPVVALPTGR